MRCGKAAQRCLAPLPEDRLPYVFDAPLWATFGAVASCRTSKNAVGERTQIWRTACLKVCSIFEAQTIRPGIPPPNSSSLPRYVRGCPNFSSNADQNNIFNEIRRRTNGNQHLHRASLKYRNDVKRKLHAYHVFIIQAGLVCQGLASASSPSPSLSASGAPFGSWLRNP